MREEDYWEKDGSGIPLQKPLPLLFYVILWIFAIYASWACFWWGFDDVVQAPRTYSSYQDYQAFVEENKP